MLLQFAINSHDRKMLSFQTDTPAVDTLIRTTFRERNEAARFSAGRFGRGEVWKSPITPLGSFRPGLFFDIVDLVQKSFPGMIEIAVQPEVWPMVRPSNKTEVETFQPENEKYDLRGYQEAVVALGAKWGRGVFAHATGSGKSLSMYSLIRTMETIENKPIRTLVVVPGTGLVQQLYSDFIEYGCPGSKIQKYCSDDDSFPVADIVIVNQEYLLPRKKMIPLLDKDGNPVRTEKGRMKMVQTDEIASDRSKDVEGYELLIVDEAQELKSLETFIYKYVLRYEAKYKFGFSGSIAPTGMSRWNVVGAVGTILDEIQPHVLQAAGILAPLHLSVVQFIHSKLPELPHVADEAERAKKAYYNEWKFIEGHEYCNQFLADLACMFENENSIVLFDHTEHGKKLFDMVNAVKDPSVHTFYIDGSVGAKDRERIRGFVRSNRNCIIVANSKCMSTGVNIPNLSNMIFAFSYGEDRDKIMQSAGRILRVAPGKKFAQLFAVCHNLKYSLDHVREQLGLFDKYYKLDDYQIEKVHVP